MNYLSCVFTSTANFVSQTIILFVAFITEEMMQNVQTEKIYIISMINNHFFKNEKRHLHENISCELFQLRDFSTQTNLLNWTKCISLEIVKNVFVQHFKLYRIVLFLISRPL